ncbi:hypothetical protein AV530_006981 [Patagioenas fasciata monilis]|uniref:Uncharacterized protein n=1 Tax=Patagioenas fasciata monilis TaxID=372326 RepID=A0A1V4KXV2_PATFA|nr:hypothetical protein AV530_006981 [Patagioenas fasciata monilis]
MTVPSALCSAGGPVQASPTPCRGEDVGHVGDVRASPASSPPARLVLAGRALAARVPPCICRTADCILVYRNLAGGCSSQKPAYYKTDQNLAHPRDFSYQQEN